MSAVSATEVFAEHTGRALPRKAIVVIPTIPLPTPTVPTGTVQKFFQPTSELVSLIK